MKKRWIYLLTALTLAVGVCTARPIISGAAPFSETTACTMTIYPEDPNKKSIKFGEDLDQANVVVDVYKVASAKKVAGYDTYTYEFGSAYSGLGTPFLAKWEKNEIKASDWQELAQEIGKVVLNNSEPDDNILFKETVNVKTKLKGLESGLYLLIARGSEAQLMEDYRITMSAEDPNVNGNIATIASSDKYTYVFAPQLISVPMRTDNIVGPEPGAENGPLPGYEPADVNPPSGDDGTTTDGNTPADSNTGAGDSYMTSDLGAWTYDVNVYLKPVRVPRYGSLEIEKRLNVYESEEEVATPSTPPTIGQEEQTTFIFEASWEEKDENGNSKTNTRVDSVTFPIIKADGTKAYDWYLYMDRIPVGTDIKVTEVYSGASYDNADKDGITRTIQVKAEKIKDGIALLNKDNTIKTIINSSQLAPEVDGNGKRTVPVEASVAFTNTYNWDQKKGYGIKNQFTYDENGKWLWTSDPQQEAGDPGTPIFNSEISHLDVEQPPQ